MLPSSGRRLKPGWTEVMYSQFTVLWDTCALTFKQNYIRRAPNRQTRVMWVGYAKCAIDGCIAVKFYTEGEKDDVQTVTICCDITGVCTHKNHPKCTYVLKMDYTYWPFALNINYN